VKSKNHRLGYPQPLFLSVTECHRVSQSVTVRLGMASIVLDVS
jgi:hypothetical protein